ncbi:Hypothetical protein PMN2A_1932 [Prochlorococcus marinus str. NATL2A]|uniref:Uncharacterized protein n=1 Tax=Prochlorococcus marinus (strain NATL2A) TaxID=59920 RepID=A7MDC9_PROMT|nr:Hypothetical protein PMN2A_1932 [Prochlorococcus marinus str. NATL2A]
MPKPNSPLGTISKVINSGTKIEMPIYMDKIISPAKNNRVDKLFRLKKPLKFNYQIIRPN